MTSISLVTIVVAQCQLLRSVIGKTLRCWPIRRYSRPSHELQHIPASLHVTCDKSHDFHGTETVSGRSQWKRPLRASCERKWTTRDFRCPLSVAGALQASRSDESRSPRIRRTTYALYKAMTQTDGFQYLLRSQGKLVIRNHLLSQSTPRLQCVLLQYFKHSRFHLQEAWQISTPVKGNNETIQRRIQPTHILLTMMLLIRISLCLFSF